MDDALREALHLYFGPKEVALIEKYLQYGEMIGYELLLPREWASEYVDAAAQSGCVVLGIEFARSLPRRPIHVTSYADYSTGPDAVQKCRELAQKDLMLWPSGADWAAFNLKE
ncbi:hypothetical protein [Deinococcus navajonensis]|uniref:Uncharacterized protein n=1 Tax=Deinococcus navajonensis TaxID=309884 RepID=A0ABV8XH57_9DEIO